MREGGHYHYRGLQVGWGRGSLHDLIDHTTIADYSGLVTYQFFPAPSTYLQFSVYHNFTNKSVALLESNKKIKAKGLVHRLKTRSGIGNDHSSTLKFSDTIWTLGVASSPGSLSNQMWGRKRKPGTHCFCYAQHNLHDANIPIFNSDIITHPNPTTLPKPKCCHYALAKLFLIKHKR